MIGWGAGQKAERPQLHTEEQRTPLKMPGVLKGLTKLLFVTQSHSRTDPSGWGWDTGGGDCVGRRSLGHFERKDLRVQGLLDLRCKGKESWNFPGGPVVKILRFQCRGHGFHPWSGKFHMLLNSVAKKRKRKLQLENLGESRSLIQR